MCTLRRIKLFPNVAHPRVPDDPKIRVPGYPVAWYVLISEVGYPMIPKFKYPGIQWYVLISEVRYPIVSKLGCPGTQWYVLISEVGYLIVSKLGYLDT